jgi:hypothetical protein
MDRAALHAFLSEWAEKWQMTGSRYICNPAPTDTDEDYIVLTKADRLFDDLILRGFKMNTDESLYDGCPDFYAFRGGEFNVICVDDPEMYARWVDATEQAKSRNLLDKSDRINLFQAVLYGVPEAVIF